MKYRITGVDIDQTRKQFGETLTLKDAKKFVDNLKASGITGLTVQNIKTGQVRRYFEKKGTTTTEQKPPMGKCDMCHQEGIIVDCTAYYERLCLNCARKMNSLDTEAQTHYDNVEKKYGLTPATKKVKPMYHRSYGFKRDNSFDIDMVELNGKLYRCEIRPRNRPGTAVYDFQPLNVKYHGTVVINTGTICASYDVDRNYTTLHFQADPTTKRGSVNGEYPLDTPIANYAMQVHMSSDVSLDRCID